jgi:hypothetical protein
MGEEKNQVMHIGFILPLALSVVGAGHFVLFTEEDWKWKALAFGMVGTSLLLSFLHVHFVIPLILQVIVCVWMIIYWKLDE